MFTTQLNRIRTKLEQVAQADPACRVFRARVHRYKLNEPLSLAELRQFEQRHGIVLPEPYATFVTELGNGGAGPYYGILRLGEKQAIDLASSASRRPCFREPSLNRSKRRVARKMISRRIMKTGIRVCSILASKAAATKRC